MSKAAAATREDGSNARGEPWEALHPMVAHIRWKLLCVAILEQGLLSLDQLFMLEADFAITCPREGGKGCAVARAHTARDDI